MYCRHATSRRCYGPGYGFQRRLAAAQPATLRVSLGEHLWRLLLWRATLGGRRPDSSTRDTLAPAGPADGGLSAGTAWAGRLERVGAHAAAGRASTGTASEGGAVPVARSAHTGNAAETPSKRAVSTLRMKTPTPQRAEPCAVRRHGNRSQSRCYVDIAPALASAIGGNRLGTDIRTRG